MATDVPNDANNKKLPRPESLEQGKGKTGGPEKSDTSNLSEQATKPGDFDALAAMRRLSGHGAGSTGKPATAGEGSAAVATPAASLDHDALQKKVEAIHEALNRRALWGVGWSSPDTDRILRELDPLNQTDRTNLEKLYAATYGGKENNFYELRKELRERLGAQADLQAMAILNRKDGISNDLGQVKVLLNKLDAAAGQQKGNNSTGFLHVASDLIVPGKFIYERFQNHSLDGDRAGAEKQLRETIAGLNSKDLQAINKDEILRDKNLSPATREALNVYFRNADPSQNGIDKRTAQDQVDLANIAIKYKNVDMLGEALRGDSPAAVEARKKFAADHGPEKLAAAFSGDDLVHASDFLKEGRISLSTIAKEDTAHWYHKNKADLEQALANASDAERSDYTKGRELAIAHKSASNQDEQRQLEFYRNTHKALLQAASDNRELSIFEDKLMRKGSLISDLAESHSDGWWITGIGKGHDTGDLLSKIENMNEQDWNRLKNDPTFKRDVLHSLSTFANEDERHRAEDLLTRKMDATNFKAASDQKRSIISTIGDDTHRGWFGSTNYDGTKIIDSISQLSTDDQKSYHDSPAFRSQLDDKINRSLKDGPEKDLAHRLLAKVAAGQELKPDAVDRVLMDNVKGAKPAQTVRDIEVAFKENPDLLKRIQNPVSQDDKDLKRYMEGALTSAVYKVGMAPEDGEGMYNQYSAALFQTGELPLPMKLQLNDNKKDSFEDIANASEAVRKQILNPSNKQERDLRDQVMANFNDDERKLVENTLRQGNLDLADRVRSLTLDDGSSYQDLREPLQKLRDHPELIEAQKNEYTKKYGRSLDDDLLSKVDPKDRPLYRDLLTPAKLDGRQDFYDQMSEHIKSRSGLGDSIMAAGLWDGSRTNLDRALNQNAAIRGEYARTFADLPPEKQAELIDQYAQAIKAYRDSKGQMTEQLVDAALVVASLAAAPLSGGASLTAILALAAAGAAFKVGATEALEGNDFNSDPKNVAKLALEGAFTTGLAVVGPAQFAAVFKVGDAAATEAVAGLGTRLVESGVSRTILREGYEQAGKKALATMTREALVSGKDLAASDFAHVAEGMVKTELTGQARKEAVQQVTRQLAAQYNVALEEGKRTLAQTILQHGRQVATETFSNAVVGGTSSAASQVVSFPLDYDPRLGLSGNLSKLGSRMTEAGLSGAAGGALFTGIFHLAKPVAGKVYGGFRGLVSRGAASSESVAIALSIREGEQIIAANSRNPVVEITHANGSRTTVASGQEYRIQAGDEITGVKPVDSQRAATGRGGEAEMREAASIAVEEEPLPVTRPKEEKLYYPERDITKLSPEERRALISALRDNVSPLIQNEPVDSFIGKAMERTAGWTEDLSQTAKRVETLREPYEREIQRYQSQVVNELMGRVSPNDLFDRDAVAKGLRGMVADGEISEAEAARKLGLFDEMAKYRTPYSDLHLELSSKLEQRRLQMEQMVNEFADEHKLPRASVRVREEMGSAQARYGDGTIYLRQDALLDNSNVAQLIESAYHEFVHHEQDNLMIRMVIDHVEKSTGKTLSALSAPEIERIQDLYKNMTKGGLSKDHLESVFAARQGRVLTESELSRARKLVDAFRNNSPVGQPWIDAGNHFRIARRELRMLEDADDPNGAYKLIGKLAADKGLLSDHLFGTQTPPPEVQRLITTYRAFERGADVDWPRRDAENMLGDLLRNRMSELNETRKVAYEKYIAGIHEKEAWVVGERARIRAKEQGASTGKKKSVLDFPFETEDEARFLQLKADDSSGMMDAMPLQVESDVSGGLNEVGQTRIATLRDRLSFIQDYNKRLVREIDKGGGKSGDAYQLDMFDIVRDHLKRLQSDGAIAPEWELFPTAIGSGADRVGADYLLVNTKSGEFQILDPSSNLEKRNVAAIRADGVIHFEPKWIDRSGALKLDPEEPFEIRMGISNFQSELTGQLHSLTQRPSLLNLNEARFPSALPPRDPAQVQQSVNQFVNWLKFEAEQYPQGSSERALLLDYAKVIERGAQKYGQVMAMKQPAPPAFAQTVQRAADVTVADIGARTAMGARLEKPAVRATSDVVVNKNGELNFQPTDDVVYAAGQADQILNDSRARMFDLAALAKAVPAGRMKQLRTLFPNENDEQLLRRVRDGIQKTGRLIGTRTTDNYRPFIDDLAARLRQRSPEDLLQIRPDAEKPLEVETPAPVQKKAPPPVPVSIETVSTTTRDFKIYWSTVMGEVRLTADNQSDVAVVMEMLLDDKIAKKEWDASQVSWFKDLMSAYENRNRDAVMMVDNILGN